MLHSNWPADQLAAILCGPDGDARKVAALALSLVGTRCCVPMLADRLKDEDPIINEMAEHALWSIWFRSGSQAANKHLCRGSKAMDKRDFESARQHFTRAIEADPDFAEAYNQRAIVEYLCERYEQAIADSQLAIERMPCHFGAWAGMGHSHAHLGRMREALASYRRALEINPHLSGIAQAVEQLQTHVDD